MNDFIGEVMKGPGWEAFLDPQRYLEYGIILVMATLSGLVLAYHPVSRNRPQSMETMELKKTLIIYTVVGAIISIICVVNPSMAFVIFGIGGLLRFRTQLKASKSTGHAIMATLVGLCWGLGLEMIAVMATAYFWVLIWFMERRSVVDLTVGGVDIADMGTSTEEYRRALEGAGCRLKGQSKNFKKGQMNFVFTLPPGTTVENVAAEVEKIPKNIRGTPDWQI